MAKVIDTEIEKLTNLDTGIETTLYTSTSKNGAHKLSVRDLDSGEYITHIWHKDLAPLQIAAKKAVR